MIGEYKEGLKVKLDKAPFIWISNQKVYPIKTVQGAGAYSPRQNDDNPFGVVDRVTISNEARHMHQKGLREGIIQPPVRCALEPRVSGKRENLVIEYTVKNRS